MTRAESTEEEPGRDLWVGPGRHAAELAGVTRVLARTRAEGSGVQAAQVLEIEDLEELLVGPRETPRWRAAGVLVLEAEEVPVEDIGIVRRFLERGSGRRLVILSPDPSGEEAVRLLGLPRSRWMPWSPTLDQLAALLQATPAAAMPVTDSNSEGSTPQTPAAGTSGASSYATQAQRGPRPMEPQPAVEDDLPPAGASPAPPAESEAYRPLRRLDPVAPTPMAPTPVSPVQETLAGVEPNALRPDPTLVDEQLVAIRPTAPDSDVDLSEREAQDFKSGRSHAPAESALAPRVDLVRLVEELLAGGALSGEAQPRWELQGVSTALVAGERSLLAPSLGALLDLARQAAGREETVAVSTGFDAEDALVLLHIDFPPGDLGDAGIDELLRRAEDPGKDQGDPLAEALAWAARAAADLRAAGAEPTLNALEDGRLRLGVEFPAAEGAVVGGS